MGHPVTTNPLIIMMINMTVVFFVLIALSGLIHLIHMVDPTKEPEVADGGSGDESAESAAIIAKLQENSSTAQAPQIEEGISPEVIAAISAAISAYGFSGQVKAVRIANHNSGWRRNALDNGIVQV